MELSTRFGAAVGRGANLPDLAAHGHKVTQLQQDTIAMRTSAGPQPTGPKVAEQPGGRNDHIRSYSGVLLRTLGWWMVDLDCP